MKDSEVQRVAQLARLQLTTEEIETLGKQLSSIIGYFEKIKSVPTEGVEPMVTPTDMEVVFREDDIHTFAGAELALEQAPEKRGQLFKVPPVV